MKIITHGGNAHLDDVMTCALVLVDRTWSYQEMHEEATIEKAFDEACEGVVIELREEVQGRKGVRGESGRREYLARPTIRRSRKLEWKFLTTGAERHWSPSSACGLSAASTLKGTF